MKTPICLAGACLLISLGAERASALQDSGRLTLEADFAAFRYVGDTALAYVEIYYNLTRSQLKYQPDEQGYVTYIDFKLTLKDTSGAVIDTLRWTAGNRIDKLSSLAQTGFLITDMAANIIPFGRYEVGLEATNDGNVGRALFYMEAPSFGGPGLKVSTIETAYNITPDTAGLFVKNGIRVMPNPAHAYNRADEQGYFYAEAYGLDLSPGADSVFYVAIEILSADGHVVQRQPTLAYEKPGESAVIASAFRIDSLDAGTYGLRVAIVDGEASVSSLSNFTVSVMRGVARHDMLQGILKEFPEAMNITSEEDAQKFRDEIIYIATREELKIYDSLPLNGKATFQRDFWARRDIDPSTPQNEYAIDHYKRFKFANTNFGQFQGGKAGWRSDRGRVFIKYGEPSEIERFAPTPEARAWERWWFHGMEGGVYFIFVDYEAAGDYTLIHSSKGDELKDYSWEDKIKFLEH
jgi:GWxTD domain-containing protein